MKIVDCGPLSVCVDCIMLIVSDEADDTHRDKFRAYQEKYGDEGVLVPGGEYDVDSAFSASRCDGCGTELAGSRHQVSAIVKEEGDES